LSRLKKLCMENMSRTWRRAIRMRRIVTDGYQTVSPCERVEMTEFHHTGFCWVDP
jgi:predicted secreted protein